MSKISITTLRKIRKELEERSQHARYNGPSFEGNKVCEAQAKKYKKEIEALAKIPLGDVFNISYGRGYNNSVLSFEQKDLDKTSVKVRDLQKKLCAEYQAAEEVFEAASEHHKFKKLASRIAALEVECLIGSITTEDPVVLSLLEDVRLALQN